MGKKQTRFLKVHVLTKVSDMMFDEHNIKILCPTLTSSLLYCSALCLCVCSISRETLKKVSESGEMHVEKTLEWLPSGWKVEVKERKTGGKDKYYTDTVSGYTFRSQRAVSHYLRTGEVPTTYRKKRFFNDVDSIRQETPIAKIQKLSSSSTREYVFTGQSSYTSKRNEEWTFRTSVTQTEESFCNQINTSRECCDQKGLTLFPLDVKVNKENQEIMFGADKRYVVALHAPAVSLVNQLVENGVGKQPNRELRPAPQISETKKELTLPSRTSRRLAGVEPEPVPEMGKHYCSLPKKAVEGVDYTEKGGHSLSEGKNELGKVVHDRFAAPREHSRKLPSENPESRFFESFLRKVLEDQGSAPEEHTRKTGSDKPDSQITLRFREPLLDPHLGFLSNTISKTSVADTIKNQHVSTLSTQKAGLGL